MNDNDIASKFKATIRIRSNSRDPLFGTGTPQPPHPHLITDDGLESEGTLTQLL